jgi:tetratricopeptide (TPR) repeat protein
LGRGGYEPHFANEVIQQRYGDCKDQTILAIALLKVLGVEAYPSLVITSRNGKPDMDLVALYFDHMVVWIPGEKPGEGIWMDTTADRALFPGMSNYLLGQSAFIVDGKGGRLTTVGKQLPQNVGSLIMNYHVDENEHLVVDVTTETSGIYEQNLRNWWIHDSNRETSLQQMMGAIFPDAKAKVKIDAKVINEDNLWLPFKIQTRFDFGIAHPEKNTPMALGVGLLQVFRIFGDISSMQIPKERKNRWVNNQSETIRINAHLSGAAEDLPAVVSSGVDVENAFFSIQQSGKQIDSNYTVNIEMTRDALDLTVTEYEQYYSALNSMADAGHWLVSYLADEKQQQLAKVTAEASSTDLQSQLSLARYYLDQGQFEKALEPAVTAVNLDRGSGEAWYVLGVVQGYNAMVDESMNSFAQASSLGYTP